MLYEKFGEFGSAGEINLLAENLFNEGDMESILTLSRENGIPEEYAQMYIDGETEELTDASTAAIGKIRQSYGAYDRKPDWDKVEPVLMGFTRAIGKRTQRERQMAAG